MRTPDADNRNMNTNKETHGQIWLTIMWLLISTALVLSILAIATVSTNNGTDFRWPWQNDMCMNLATGDVEWC